MAAKLGSIKEISGQTEVIAVDKSGNERILKVGDSLYEGESIKTTSADAKVVIVANDGKEVSVVGEDTISLDPKEIANAQSANPEVAALQNALLNGANITDLEETAAGGNAAAGGAGGDGVSLGAASFAEGGHYANINENFRNLTDANRAFDSFNSPIGGYADNNDNGEGDSVAPQNPTNPVTPVTPVTPPTPVTPATLVAPSVSLDGSGEAREATPNEYLVYNLGLSAPTSSTTPTDLTLNLSGASAGRDYSNTMEYSLDGGNSWTPIQNGGTISGVAPSDIANVKVRVQVLDDYGQTADNQNEGTSSENLGANIAPGINGYGVYKEGITLSVTTNNAAITSGEAEGKIIDNDDKIDITHDINPNEDPDAETIIDHSLINYDPDNGNTMKTIIDTKDGDDTITIKEGVEFSSGLNGFKDDGNDVIKMGDGDDVLNIEKSDAEINGEMKYGSVSSIKIDMGNAGKNNQDTVIIDGGTVLNTMITSHDGNDIFTVRGDATLGDVLFKTGKGEDTVNIESGITVTSLKSVKIDTGADDDIVNIKHDLIDDWANHGSTDGSEYEGVRTASFIKTGEGNDTINVTGASISGVDIDTGDGDLSKEPHGDTLEFISAAIRDSEIKSGNGDDKYTFKETNLNEVAIESGKGIDNVKIGDDINMKNSSINTGEGNDTVDLGKGVVLDNSNITGGDGIDTLKIHDNSFNTTNAGKISGFEVLDMSGINADTKFIFHNASDIVNFIKNVGGESVTSLTVKGGAGKFEDGTPEITTSREADGNPNTYKVTDGSQTFTLTIEDLTINPSI